MIEAIPFVARGSAAFKVLDLMADTTNYLLLAWLLGVLFVGTRRQIYSGKDWLAVALSIAVVYVLKTLDRKIEIWERFDLNYSTHSALAAVVVLSLYFLDGTRSAFAIAAFVVYGVLQMLLGFHSLLDILTTLIVVLPLAWLCLRPIAKRREVVEPS